MTTTTAISNHGHKALSIISIRIRETFDVFDHGSDHWRWMVSMILIDCVKRSQNPFSSVGWSLYNYSTMDMFVCLSDQIQYVMTANEG